MTGPEDEIEFEVGVRLCRCRAPRVAAPALQQRFQDAGLQVIHRSARDEEWVELVAKRIERMTVRFPRVRVRSGTRNVIGLAASVGR